jgi:hypothetical protein
MQLPKIFFLLYTIYVSGTMLFVLGYQIAFKKWKSPYPKRMVVINLGAFAWLIALLFVNAT